MQVKLSEAVDLMTRCIDSCTSVPQLWLMLDWVEDSIKPEKFPSYNSLMVLQAGGSLMDHISSKRIKLYDLEDSEEVDIKAHQLNPQ